MIDSIKKLAPIERNHNGSLPRMSAKQRNRANALIKRECCNYGKGNCLVLDDGESCVCVQSISYSVNCRWFRWAVLPLDTSLETELLHKENSKTCSECGATFQPKSNRAKYCSDCAKLVHRRQKATSERKRRANVDN